MGRVGLEARLLTFAFLCLCVTGNGWATKREELERAAELAVERAAERAAERAVEKALESGNSTTETETIRESYSSVRLSDKTVQLPASGYTPAQRHEYDRIVREREAAEKASAVLKRSFLKRSVDNRGVDARQLLEVGKSNERGSGSDSGSDSGSEEKQQLQQPEKVFPETASPTVGPFYITRQLPFPAGGYQSPYVIAAGDEQRQQHQQQQQQQQRQQRLPPGKVITFRDGDKFPTSYPVKVFAIQTSKLYPLKLFRVVPPEVAPDTIATSSSPESYPSSDRETPNAGDDSVANEDRRRPGQGWIYR